MIWILFFVSFSVRCSCLYWNNVDCRLFSFVNCIFSKCLNSLSNSSLLITIPSVPITLDLFFSGDCTFLSFTKPVRSIEQAASFIISLSSSSSLSLTLTVPLLLLWHGSVNSSIQASISSSTGLSSDLASLVLIDSIDSNTFFALLHSLSLAVLKVYMQGSSSPPCGKSNEYC